MFLSLKSHSFIPDIFTKWTLEENISGEPLFKALNLWHPLLLLLLLKKGRSIRFIWIAHAYLYEQVTELLLGGHCLTFNRAHRLTESLQQLVGCRNDDWHPCCLHSLPTGLFSEGFTLWVRICLLVQENIASFPSRFCRLIKGHWLLFPPFSCPLHVHVRQQPLSMYLRGKLVHFRACHLQPT